MRKGGPLRALLPPSLAVLLGGCTLALGTDGFRALTEEGARRLRVAEEAPPAPFLVLEDMRGAEVPLGRGPAAPGGPAAVEFVYATCPDVCVAAAADFARLRDRLVAAGLGGRARLLSVSFDPRDGPAELRDYGERHGADGRTWTVARPLPGDLPRLLRGYGLRVIPDGWGGFQHNAAIHVVDGEGRLVGIFDTADVDGAFRALAELR